MNKKLTIAFIALLISLSTYSQYEYPDVVIETNKGTIKVMLYDNTYKHSDNFIKLVKEGFYDSVLFHRVIKDFMIQTGDNTSKNAEPGKRLGTGGKKYKIPAEIFPEYYHKKGALAAARQGNNVNPKKESSGSQFYIVEGTVFDTTTLNKFVASGMHPPFNQEQKDIYTTKGGTPHLDYQYSVFGEVYEGIEVVDSISVMPGDQDYKDVYD